MLPRLLIALLTPFAALAIANAQPDPGADTAEPGLPGPRMRHHRLMDKLNLTDQQQSQLSTLRASFQKKTIDLRSRIQTLRVDLRQAALADNPDRGAIEKIVTGMSDLQRQQRLNLIDHLFAVRGILTPEQQKVWKVGMGRIGTDAGGHMRGRRLERGRMWGQALPDEAASPADEELLGEELSDVDR